MAKGDHIKVWRVGDYVSFTHHGIDCGDGTVIHFTGEPGKGTKENGKISQTSVDDFKKDAPEIEVVEDTSDRAPDEVVAAATSRLGEGGYDLFENNCEHFASDCRTGEHRSEQVELAKAAINGISEAIGTVYDGICEIGELYQEMMATDLVEDI